MYPGSTQKKDGEKGHTNEKEQVTRKYIDNGTTPGKETKGDKRQ
jgi:hypothetical protein